MPSEKSETGPETDPVPVRRVSTLQVVLAPGASVKKAAGAVRQSLQKDALRQQGYTWTDTEQYEHEVNVLQRFLVDTSVSGGGYGCTACLPTAACNPAQAEKHAASDAHQESHFTKAHGCTSLCCLSVFLLVVSHV